MKIRVLIIIPAIIVFVILVIVAYDSVFLDKLCQDNGGNRIGDICQIPITTTNDFESDFDISKITSMKPNSMEFFYYPNPEDTENRDAFQKFILIRLTEELGGGIDDVSSFRAYSALSVGDHCLVKYWPDQGRQRIEDPCWGSMYRVIDGLLIVGLKPVINTTPVALPQLDLSIDENGSLYVEPPVWTLDQNGVVGVGRQMSLEKIRQGSQILVDSFEKSHPQYPLIPLDFAGYILSQIESDRNRVQLRYFDFTSIHEYLSFDIGLATAQDHQYLLNTIKSNSEFWQIDDTIIKIGGNALEKNKDEPERFKEYEIQFIKDGYNFKFGGKNLEFMKKEIIANYFPENNYDDMFLISRPLE